MAEHVFSVLPRSLAELDTLGLVAISGKSVRRTAKRQSLSLFMASVGLSGACLGVQLEFTEDDCRGETVRLTTDMSARAVCMTQARYSHGHHIVGRRGIRRLIQLANSA